MKKVVATVLAFLLAGTAMGAVVQIDIPQDLVAPLQEVCAEVQIVQKFASFTDEECAAYLVRLGALTWRVEKAKLVTRAAQKNAILDAIQAEVDLVNQAWPLPGPVECGNGVVENVPALGHTEECDDGNTANGDGCDAGCMNE